MRNKKSNKNKFKKFLITYIKVLIVLMILVVIYVINSLITYKNLQVNNYLASTMQKVIDSGKKGNISKYIDISQLELSEYESKNSTPDQTLAKALESSNLIYKLNSESTDLNNPVYDVYINDNPFLSVKLNGERKLTRLGLLTIQDWKLDEISLNSNSGVYECIVEVPNNYTVYINDIKINDKDKENANINEELNELSKYADLPYIIQYKISDLLSEPKVKIEDENGNEIEYEKQENLFSVALKTETIEDEETALAKIKGDIDVMQIAKDWSLYLTNDLGGTLHGFNKINKYLIKNSYMYNYAYKWATDIDITFISSHIFDNPAFTNTKVSNFKIYSENAFSCDVYLEKNMLLNKKGNQKIQDVMNERMYFAYYEGEWKLVNMQSITKNN